MRAGGGKDKGSAWEREVGRHLSLWLTNGERPDIFARNVLSGGAFTVMEKKGEASSRMPGDIMAAHPLAFQFLSHFSVECKHLKDIGLEQYLFEPDGVGLLSGIINLAQRQAASIGLHFMVIAKQNRRPPLVFVKGIVGDAIMSCVRKRRGMLLLPMRHDLHRRAVTAFRLEDMVERVDPDLMFAYLKDLSK